VSQRPFKRSWRSLNSSLAVAVHARTRLPLRGWSSLLIRLVRVVLVVVLAVVSILPVGVLKMTPVSIGVANPTARPAVERVPAVFRLAPTSVPVVVALDPHAMIAVRVAALVGMSKRYG